MLRAAPSSSDAEGMPTGSSTMRRSPLISLRNLAVVSDAAPIDAKVPRVIFNRFSGGAKASSGTGWSCSRTLCLCTGGLVRAGSAFFSTNIGTWAAVVAAAWAGASPGLLGFLARGVSRWTLMDFWFDCEHTSVRGEHEKKTAQVNAPKLTIMQEGARCSAVLLSNDLRVKVCDWIGYPGDLPASSMQTRFQCRPILVSAYKKQSVWWSTGDTETD